ncbi:hypothetical protein [Candidatus Oscillochloris fontis]|uniref:hypothetical protein n=1 Tax=Candidatus Oscillochloris fontis TaxID=2496868 RepID=UPI00101C6BA4|nr:hypothetical protein [Candidatus Oscillochloris fontis]
MRKLIPHVLTILVSLLLFGVSQIFAHPGVTSTTLPSAFTYQGQLLDGDQPANGTYSLTFRLYDALVTGTQIGNTVVVNEVTVTHGIFTVQLDFGTGAFAGPRYLEIEVGNTLLSPRQPITPAPTALYAASTPWTGLIGIPEGLADGDNDTTYTAGIGLALENTTFRAQGSPYAQVITVATSGGDFTSIQAAIDSITDAGATKPYLIFIAPGIYTEHVILKPYITLEGSGEEATVIRWTGGDQYFLSGNASVTLTGSAHATVRSMTIESDGTGKTYSIASYNPSTATTTFQDVMIKAAGGTENYGIYNNYGLIKMNNVQVHVSGGTSINRGINLSGNFHLDNITITVTGAGSSTNQGISISGAGSIMNLTATVTGGNRSTAIHNEAIQSTPTLMNVIASASGATTDNYGMFNFAAKPKLINGILTATGGTNSYGVFSTFMSEPTLTNVTATATGGTKNYGIYTLGTSTATSTATISTSVFTGSTNSAYQSGSIVKITQSQLNGPLSTGLTCFGNYNANLAAVTCP